jgi:hypothetical protein
MASRIGDLQTVGNIPPAFLSGRLKDCMNVFAQCGADNNICMHGQPLPRRSCCKHVIEVQTLVEFLEEPLRYLRITVVSEGSDMIDHSVFVFGGVRSPLNLNLMLY